MERQKVEHVYELPSKNPISTLQMLAMLEDLKECLTIPGLLATRVTVTIETLQPEIYKEKVRGMMAGGIEIDGVSISPEELQALFPPELSAEDLEEINQALLDAADVGSPHRKASNWDEIRRSGSGETARVISRLSEIEE